MITSIIKRDGRIVPFDVSRITRAVFKAARSVGGTDKNEAEKVANEVVRLYEKYHENETPTVEEIQDAVEKVLIERGHAATAKAYILYRNDRTNIRDSKTNLMKVLGELTYSSAKDSDTKRENANIDGDTAMGTMLKYGSSSAKAFYLMNILKKEHSKAHSDGDIHIHDLDFYTLTTTCCQIDLVRLFKGGFSTGHGHLREPNDISSYSALACIAIQSNQNDQHGGQSVPNFDYAMSEGVRKTYARKYVENLAKGLSLIVEDLSYKDALDLAKAVSKYVYDIKGVKPVISDDNDYRVHELAELCKSYTLYTCDKVQKFAVDNALLETERATYQAMEAFVHNLNTMHSRAGAQVPFSSINYGTDTSPEGRLVIKNLLYALEAGLGNGETPIFPIHIFKVKEGVSYNPTDPNYDLFKLAMRVSAKRLFPNFSFIDAPFNLQFYKEGHPETEVAYMGCRTRVMGNNYDPTREIAYSRGNLSFTSINLPRLAIKAEHDINKFFEMLKDMLDLTIDQLNERFKIQCRKKVRNYPFLMEQGVWLDSDKLSIDDTVEEVLKHGTLTVGFIGLAETLKALIGKHHGESEEARKLGLEIVSYMRKRVDLESENTGLNYSLIATPAEGLSGRFVKIDREKYGVIEGVTDRDYYTNSFHVPVYYNINALDKIKIEAPYHALTNGGHISYIELDGDPLENLPAFEKIIRCMKESGIGYGSINHPVDRDPECGFTGIIGDTCPKCGREENDSPFERIRRITGYLVGTLDRFNNAKRAEERDRVKHNVSDKD